uniref:protein Spindly-like n=1 Tax=Ciona intestinalis TaxID=7719 RepID=UPI000180BC0D|nr:protein Spindly-like [Ciona intestinalis]|eukprot:XP_002129174.1 protein Spindly-like [Ciona intestinalis]
MANSFQNEIESLKETIEQNNKDLYNAGVQGKALLERNEQLENEIQQLHIEYTKTNEELEQEKYSLKSRIDFLEKSEKRLENSILEEKQSLRIDVDRKCEGLDKLHRAEISAIKHQMKELQNELDESRLIQRQQEDKINKQNELLDDVEARRRQIHNDSCTTELELATEVEKLKIEIIKLRKESMQHQNLNERYELQVAAMQKELFDLNEQKRNVEKDRETYYNQLERCRQEKRDVQSELDAVMFQASDPNSRGNSLFGEVEDKRVIAEKNLISAQIKLKCLKKRFDQQVSYALHLKTKIAQLWQTRGGSAEQDRIRRLEVTLSTTRNDYEKAMSKISKLEVQLFDKSTKVTSALKEGCTDADFAGFLEGIIKKKESELKETKKELDETQLFLMAETNKVSEAERALYRSRCDCDTLRAKVVKLNLEIAQLKLEHGSGGRVKSAVKKGNREIIGDCDVIGKENGNILQEANNLITSTPSDDHIKNSSDDQTKPKQAVCPDECKQQ